MNAQILRFFIPLAVLSLILQYATAQPYAIGQTETAFYDPDRNDRPVPTRIFYPANSNGSGVPVASGEFPVIAFGHGFIMVYSAYQYLWEALVPEGYIIAFPTTEGSAIPAPDHLAFGLDLRFLIDKLKSEGENPTSLFYTHVADSSAVMGHSMGGGASFLACENFTGISTMVTMAAAETNPSAIQAAQNVTIPALLFSGTYDCVTPPPNHQEPMYNNLSSYCKTHISITGGGHCYFAGYNFNCSLGELFCNPPATITRAEQHAIVLTHLLPYLDFRLRGNEQSWFAFQTLLDNPSGITSQQQCSLGFVSIKAFLEGPFNGSSMVPILNANGFLPLSQPYNQPPWNYFGAESVAAIPNANIVDWILVELRDTTDASLATSQTVIAQQAGFLLNDGSVVATDGSSILQFSNVTIQHSLFAVVWHRNHPGIMSAVPLVENGGIYSYDFTTGAGQVHGSNLAHKEIAPGIWGMAAGDGNADGQINNGDKNDVWVVQAGASGYMAGDFNMDSQVNNGDKNDRWVPNTGMGGQVPD